MQLALLDEDWKTEMYKYNKRIQNTNKRENSLLLLLSFSSSGSLSGQGTHASTYIEYISKLKRLSEEEQASKRKLHGKMDVVKTDLHLAFLMGPNVAVATDFIMQWILEDSSIYKVSVCVSAQRKKKEIQSTKAYCHQVYCFQTSIWNYVRKLRRWNLHKNQGD